MNALRTSQLLASKSMAGVSTSLLASTQLRCSMARATPVLARQLHLQPYKDEKKSVVNPELYKIPEELLNDVHPKAIRNAFISRQLSSEELEKWDIGLTKHREPITFGDKVALTVVKSLRIPADLFFRKKYMHRAVALETVAAVPGMVGAVIRHLRSLRKMKHDGGWITHLLHEAENERMHLLTWMKVCQPTLLERMLVTAVQGVFFNCFFLFYLCTPKTAHRIVGYLEEEAVISYTGFLKEIDEGRIENKPAPQIAIDYWNLQKSATIRDVVLAVRADEALHRDTNHHFSDRISLRQEDLRTEISRTKLLHAQQAAEKSKPEEVHDNEHAGKWA
ncbi:alternative oxidase [Basidiobolus meristosporus CBS 931.73]|uniref:Alternative oxidase n=1 Tax=Basidiobolus meristosporus CBS 931.73 TaxID=1314790 RepID=A0A1Y1XXK9_9FUNG|nr:alternative oxidase [Basidiobolus meristosporus CBS 931.73]|eukprot:ORX90490.1 alternative oxidase [Basidiobolus meristosporus CBS 931.73]